MDSLRRCIGVVKCPLIIWFLCVSWIWMVVFVSCSECATLKRSASPDFNSENSESGMDKINVSYDEYPVGLKVKCILYYTFFYKFLNIILTLNIILKLICTNGNYLS